MANKLVFNPASGEIEFQTIAETIGVEGRVVNFAALPSAAANTGNVYLVEQDSGSIFLLNKKEAGLYRSNGAIWTPFSDVTAYSIEIDDTVTALGATNVQEAIEELKILVDAAGGGAVSSVNGQTGTVVLTKSDVGLANADNTSDVNKPVSTATQTALNLKQDLITVSTSAPVSPSVGQLWVDTN